MEVTVMYLVSKSKSILFSLLVTLFVAGGLVLTTPTKAEALSTKITASPTGHVQRIESLAGLRSTFPSGVLTLSGSRPVQAEDEGPSTAANIACNATPIIGIGVSLVTDWCDTPVSAVADAVGDIIDCATSPMECVTDWVYSVIGGVVSWAANGVVSLVAGIRTECIPEGGSAEFSSGDNAACESRIALDYFPQGEDDSARVARALEDQNRAAMVIIARQLRTERDQEVRNRLNSELELLRSSGADQAAAAAGTSASTQNGIFYTPKSAVSTRTFDREYGKYVLIAAMLLVPMVIAAALQSVITGKGGLMLRSVVLHLPLAIVGMIVSPHIIRALMAITDSFSAYVLSDVRDDVDGFFTNATDSQATMGITMLMPFGLVALIFALAAMMVWFILNVREASVSLIAVFMPLAFAASVWPAMGRWIIRAIKLLMAAIISKIFIVGAISLGIGTFAGSTSSAGGTGMSFSHLLYGATIFAIAAFSPGLVMRFFDEIGDAINSGSTGAMARLSTAANLTSVGGPALRGLKGAGGGAGAAAGGLGSLAGSSAGGSIGSGAGQIASSVSKGVTSAMTDPNKAGPKTSGSASSPGTTSPGSGGKSPGGGTSAGGTTGGAGSGPAMPKGASGGHDMSGSTPSGLSVPGGSSFAVPTSSGDNGLNGYEAGATSNFHTGAYEAPGTGSSPSLDQIDLSSFSGSAESAPSAQPQRVSVGRALAWTAVGGPVAGAASVVNQARKAHNARRQGA